MHGNSNIKLSETCRVLFQNKFEKLVQLDGFIIGIEAGMV
jgi:hypothetical protein